MGVDKFTRLSELSGEILPRIILSIKDLISCNLVIFNAPICTFRLPVYDVIVFMYRKTPESDTSEQVSFYICLCTHMRALISGF